MKLKVITLNMWQGMFLDEVIGWLKQENPDVVMLQEAIGKGEGKFEGVNQGGFEKIEAALGMDGVHQPMAMIKNEQGFYEFGMGVLTKYEFEQNIGEFYINQFRQVSDLLEINEQYPGLLVEVRLGMDGKEVEVLTTHFVWSMYPEITATQVEAAKKLKQLLRDKDNFILGGDFNVTDSSEVYKIISDGLVDDRPASVETTLHPKIHRVKGIKLAVDFLFHKGERIKLIKSEVPMVPISDHLPIVGFYEIN